MTQQMVQVLSDKAWVAIVGFAISRVNAFSVRTPMESARAVIGEMNLPLLLKCLRWHDIIFTSLRVYDPEPFHVVKSQRGRIVLQPIASKRVLLFERLAR